jgi:hypothetical protein
VRQVFWVQNEVKKGEKSVVWLEIFDQSGQPVIDSVIPPYNHLKKAKTERKRTQTVKNR